MNKTYPNKNCTQECKRDKNHINEVILFLNTHKIDICLISESHSIDNIKIKFPNYNVYYAHIIRSSLDHIAVQSPSINEVQGVVTQIRDFPFSLKIGVTYRLLRQQCEESLLHTTNPPFLITGNSNVKHSIWRSRLLTPSERNLLKVVQLLDLEYVNIY